MASLRRGATWPRVHPHGLVSRVARSLLVEQVEQVVLRRTSPSEPLRRVAISVSGRALARSPEADLKVTRVPTIDLFAGAGGLSIAASRAGCDVRLHVDFDAAACETLRINQ